MSIFPMSTLGPIGTTNKRRSAAWWLSGGISAANCVAAYQPKGAASLAASYVNASSPGTYDAFLGIAPTLGALGWVGTASSYLRTGIVPSSGWSAICRFSNAPTTGPNWAFGSNSSGKDFSVLPNYAGAIYWQNGGTKSLAVALSSGVLGFAGNTAYRDGVAESGAIGAWSGGAGIEIYLLGLNTGSPGFLFTNGIISAIAFYNTVLSAAQFLAVTNAMNAL